MAFPFFICCSTLSIVIIMCVFARPRIPREIHHERLAHNAQPAGYYREVCIDRLYFNEDGTIKSVEPTL